MRIHNLARDAVAEITVHGASKGGLGALNRFAVRSLLTERAYRDAYAGYLRWLSGNRIELDRVHTRGMMLEWLDELSETSVQKSVDRARQALQKIFSVSLPHVESCQPPRVHGRAYIFDDVRRVLSRQRKRQQLAALISFDCGLRAHECITLRERFGAEPSSHRRWSADMFKGRSDYVIFIVTGKGGLRREVAISIPLALELRRYKRPEPVTVRDRGVNHISYFDIGGGQALSSSFSRASELVLGYSNGLHGLRHSFAQNRLTQLLSILEPKRALETLSNELGHWRPGISLAYLVGG
jgi:integrase